MIQYLKKGISAVEQNEADAKVKATVENMITDVTENGDAAVRQYSQKFDNWTPASFKLSEQEIAAVVASLPDQVISDIKFAQSQIRNFAIEISPSILSDVMFLEDDIPW